MKWKFWEKELNESVKMSPNSGFFKKGKIQVTIIYEDRSKKDFLVKIDNAYRITINKKDYFVIPKAFIFGKLPELHFYYNNPWPVYYEHKDSKVTAKDLTHDKILKLYSDDMKEQMANLHIDSETLHHAFTSNVIKKIYEEPGMTTKTLLIIIGAVVLAILIILHFTGVIDLTSLFSGGKK